MDNALSFAAGVFVGLFLSAAFNVAAQDTWTCHQSGNARICSGWQGGKWVTCTTYYFGSTSSTTCQ